VYQKDQIPFGIWSFCFPGGTRKGGMSEAKVKTCRWHVFSPWESP